MGGNGKQVVAGNKVDTRSICPQYRKLSETEALERKLECLTKRQEWLEGEYEKYLWKSQAAREFLEAKGLWEEFQANCEDSEATKWSAELTWAGWALVWLVIGLIAGYAWANIHGL